MLRTGRQRAFNIGYRVLNDGDNITVNRKKGSWRLCTSSSAFWSMITSHVSSGSQASNSEICKVNEVRKGRFPRYSLSSGLFSGNSCMRGTPGIKGIEPR